MFDNLFIIQRHDFNILDECQQTEELWNAFELHVITESLILSSVILNSLKWKLSVMSHGISQFFEKIIMKLCPLFWEAMRVS